PDFNPSSIARSIPISSSASLRASRKRSCRSSSTSTSAAFTASFRSLDLFAAFIASISSSQNRQCLKPPPSAAVAREQIVGFFRAPGTGGIKKKTRRIFCCGARVLDWVYERPGFFNFIAPREKCGVAAHRVEKQTFVCFRAGFAERGTVMEIHFHRLDAETCARHLGLHAQRDAFVGLNPNDEHVLLG